MFSYRVVPLPETWPGESTPSYGRKPSPFKVNWGSTLSLLEGEVRALRGTDVTMALSVQPSQIRADGGVYAKARIQCPSVILSLTSGKDRLQFATDRFDWWEDNVRAIALIMEALRKVERYGGVSGRQYQGFKALPSGASVPAPARPSESAIADAIRVLKEYTVEIRPLTVEHARLMVRTARARTHPDLRNGSDRDFLDVQHAAESLSLYFGVAL